MNLLFIMDLTISMKPYIEECKTNLSNMAKFIETKYQGNVEYGFVAYRDFYNKPDEHFET